MALMKCCKIRIHPDGRRFILLFTLISVLLFFLSSLLGWVGLIVTGWCAAFFRDPVRTIPQRSGLVLSPADGCVQKISIETLPEELKKKEERLRISIFLNVFDVHVNRIPCQGKLTEVIYHPGKFFNASLDKASVHNERQTLRMTTAEGAEIIFCQIAGLIARRIRTDVKEGQHVYAGQRFGIIRFGSRVDVYLPKGANPLVVEGQRMIGGETILADLNSAEPQREGKKD